MKAIALGSAEASDVQILYVNADSIGTLSERDVAWLRGFGGTVVIDSDKAIPFDPVSGGRKPSDHPAVKLVLDVWGQSPVAVAIAMHAGIAHALDERRYSLKTTPSGRTEVVEQPLAERIQRFAERARLATKRASTARDSGIATAASIEVRNAIGDTRGVEFEECFMGGKWCHRYIVNASTGTTYPSNPSIGSSSAGTGVLVDIAGESVAEISGIGGGGFNPTGGGIGVRRNVEECDGYHCPPNFISIVSIPGAYSLKAEVIWGAGEAAVGQSGRATQALPNLDQMTANAIQEDGYYRTTGWAFGPSASLSFPLIDKGPGASLGASLTYSVTIGRYVSQNWYMYTPRIENRTTQTGASYEWIYDVGQRGHPGCPNDFNSLMRGGFPWGPVDFSNAGLPVVPARPADAPRGSVDHYFPVPVYAQLRPQGVAKFELDRPVTTADSLTIRVSSSMTQIECDYTATSFDYLNPDFAGAPPIAARRSDVRALPREERSRDIIVSAKVRPAVTPSQLYRFSSACSNDGPAMTAMNDGSVRAMPQKSESGLDQLWRLAVGGAGSTRLESALNGANVSLGSALSESLRTVPAAPLHDFSNCAIDFYETGVAPGTSVRLLSRCLPATGAQYATLGEANGGLLSAQPDSSLCTQRWNKEQFNPPGNLTLTASHSGPIQRGSPVLLVANLSSGTGPLHWTWRRDGQPIPGNAATNSVSVESGTYSVTVSNAAGSATASHQFTVLHPPPVINSQPQDTRTVAGRTATFSVGASGSSTLSYAWYRRGSAGAASTLVAGATSSILVISNAQVSMSGQRYYAVVQDSTGTPQVTSAEATLTVDPALAITSQPANASVPSGQPVTFSVVAVGGGVSYQWQYNGQPIPGATASTYLISAASQQAAGSYRVVVSDVHGSSMTSLAATLSITVPVPPHIDRSPMSNSLTQGETLTLSVAASGPNLTYQWFHNGISLPGRTSNQLVIPSITSSQAGAYWVEVSNPGGAVRSATATVRVLARIAANSTVRIVSACNDQAVQAAGPNSGNRLVVGSRSSSALQRWTLRPAPGATNAWQFVNVGAPSRAATSPNGASLENTILRLEGTVTQTPTCSQRFRFSATSDGSRTITNDCGTSRKNVAADSAGTVVLRTARQQCSQQWFVEAAE